ncbi:MAG: hypothetical protein QOG85_1946 [Gaiellaceae bacterium]|jgi:hypothetical protein|nr:hypothetical protein [Gaiellaceae bacterium]
MADRVEFEFRLTGTGWAEGRLAIGASFATPTASYLSDALGGLIRAVRALLEGAVGARTWWEEEPGEYRWVFQRVGSEVRVRLLAFPDQMDEAPDADGETLLDATCELKDLGLAVVSGAQRVLDDLGPDEYLRRWVEHPFPTDDLAAVQRLLSDSA